MLLEDLKSLGERMTGIGRPERVVPLKRKPHLFRFEDDGETPNNPHLPLILYRSPVRLDPDFDPAALFEALFAAHGWGKSWRDGIYDFNHFHTGIHEVLGIARGQAKVRFGGRHGKAIALKAGDVVVQPAGTGHQRLSKSRDLLVVGAYPSKGRYDEPEPGEADHARALAAIAKTPLPAADPVYGRNGPLKQLWRR
ncbi:MAG TPA: hypothetical protein VG501_10445 [Rhizomicrobium sp.]|nr:hypothetical protein [Rhizomicrobium sp.]